jgi:hypothetical protein
MGTNYYATEAPCPSPCAHCSVETLHIGKSLVMFQGHEASPWGPIRSWQDWKRALLSHPRPTITDEYDRTHTAESFIAEVEATDYASRRRQYEWMVDHYATSENDWLDGDHFSFTSTDFT